MICPNCGKKIPDESLFCAECGNKIVRPAKTAEPTQNAAQTSAHSTVSSSGVSGAAGKAIVAGTVSISAKVVGIAVAAVLTLAVALVFAITRKPTVDLNKYMVVTYEGYDGYGTAYAKLDYDAFYKEYAGKLKLNKAALCEDTDVTEDELDQLLSLTSIDSVDFTDTSHEDLAVNTLYGLFLMFDVYQLDKTDNLSNGDVIKNTYMFSEKDEKMLEDGFTCKFKLEQKEYKVSGLGKVGTYDAFANVSLEYKGRCPYVSAEVVNSATDEMGQELRYTVEPNRNLSNGDTVTVKVSNAGTDNLKHFANAYGKIPDKTEITYTVEGMDSYISTAADISSDVFEAMDQVARDRQAKDMKTRGRTEPSEIDYIGNCFFSNVKDDNYYTNGENNRIYLCYKIDNDFYMYYMFNNLIMSADGVVSVDLSDYEESYYWGYEDLDALLERITPAEKLYSVVENNIFEKQGTLAGE